VRHDWLTKRRESCEPLPEEKSGMKRTGRATATIRQIALSPGYQAHVRTFQHLTIDAVSRI
jgi:hypothetical protein